MVFQKPKTAGKLFCSPIETFTNFLKSGHAVLWSYPSAEHTLQQNLFKRKGEQKKTPTKYPNLLPLRIWFQFIIIL